MKTVVGIAIVAAVVTGLLFGTACQPKDTTKPEARYVYPTGTDTLRVGTINLKVLATDDRAIDFVTFSANTTVLGTRGIGVADTYTIPWSADSGAYILKSGAFDKAGNQGVAPWVMVMVLP